MKNHIFINVVRVLIIVLYIVIVITACNGCNLLRRGDYHNCFREIGNATMAV